MEFITALRQSLEDWSRATKGSSHDEYFAGMLAAIRLLEGETDWLNERPISNIGHSSWKAGPVYQRAMILVRGETPHDIPAH